MVQSRASLVFCTGVAALAASHMMLSDAGSDAAAMLWVLFSAVLSSVVGFAFSAIASAVLLHLTEPIQAVQIMLVCSIAIQAYSVAVLWRDIRWNAVWPFLGGGLLTMPLGVHLLLNMPSQYYKVIMGCFLIAYGGIMMFRPKPAVFAGGCISDLTAGALGGITGGLAGFPGAFVTIWCGMRGWDKQRQRAVYQPFILLMQIATLAYMGFVETSRPFNPALLQYAPAALLGAYGGFALFRQLNDRQFNMALYGMLVISGVALLG